MGVNVEKYKLISALAEETAKEVVRNEENWRRYLNTASRLYKYPFKEQLLIYAQRPDATACASIEIWNEKMHCWVNKGAKGIALIDEDSFSGLKYVFDISDVHKARRIGQFPNLWEMREEHMEAVLSRLEKTYGDTDREAGFVGRIREMFATPQARDYRTGQSSRWEDKEHRSRNLNDQVAMFPTPTTGAGLCGGTGNYQQLKKLEQEGKITEEERRNMSQGNGGQLNPDWVEWLMGSPPWLDGYWDVEPDIPRIAKGIPNRVERLKGLGNAVVPQQFYPVLKAIADVERSRYAGSI